MIAVRSRNFQSKFTDCVVFFDGERNGERIKYHYRAAELLLKVCGHENRDLAEEWLQFQYRSELTSKDCKSSLRNFTSSDDIVNEGVKENHSIIDMVPANMVLTTSDEVVDNHTFFLRNIQATTREQLAFARNDEVVLRPFVKHNTPKRLLHSNFCMNVYVKIKRYV